ncbi:MAG: tRNA epoxyqueuosine(34) reductase QueG [Planctomycetota bacterium]
MTDAALKPYAVERAPQLGFAAAGVARAGTAPHGEAFRRWLAARRQASMAYMAEHVDQRCDLRLAWPWARSVLCLAASYAPRAGADQTSPIARYARGRDYHRVLKARCRTLADELVERMPGLQTRICVDTAPLLERDWAAAAGLGWIGKNACLIHPTRGSYLLLAEIVLSAELPSDAPMADRCGDCRACLDACPNRALVAPRELDARRCNSWATVEHRGGLDADAFDTDGFVFGCDLCQQVCPYNRDLPAGEIDDLVTPRPPAAADIETILAWSPADWDAATRGSATRRAGYAPFLRNAALAVGRQRLAAARDRLETLARHDDRAVRAAARWALGRLDA